MKRTITNKSTKGLSLKIYADATSAWHACFQEQSTHPSKKKSKRLLSKTLIQYRISLPGAVVVSVPVALHY